MAKQPNFTLFKKKKTKGLTTQEQNLFCELSNLLIVQYLSCNPKEVNKTGSVK